MNLALLRVLPMAELASSNLPLANAAERLLGPIGGQVILVLALITNLFTQRMRRLPVGRAWEALREDETACQALGINPTNTKLTAFAIGAMFGGFAGSFFAARQGFVSPESFVFIESAIILAIVVLVLSGMSIWKPVQFQELAALMGGFDAARVVHFAAMAIMVAVVLVHIVMVILVPRTFPTMITGGARVPIEPPEVAGKENTSKRSA